MLIYYYYIIYNVPTTTTIATNKQDEYGLMHYCAYSYITRTLTHNTLY